MMGAIQPDSVILLALPCSTPFCTLHSTATLPGPPGTAGTTGRIEELLHIVVASASDWAVIMCSFNFLYAYMKLYWKKWGTGLTLWMCE